VEVALTVSGNLQDFDGTARQAVVAAFAADLGIDASRVVITSVIAGSVIIQFRITNPSVPALPPPVLPPPPPVSTTSDGGVETWIIAVSVVIGVLVIVGVVLIVKYLCCNKECPEEGKRGTGEGDGKVARVEEGQGDKITKVKEADGKVANNNNGKVVNEPYPVDKAN